MWEEAIKYIHQEERNVDSDRKWSNHFDHPKSDVESAIQTHKEIMRAIGLDERYEKHLWDSQHGL